jgi:transcription elongation factor Elf1
MSADRKVPYLKRCPRCGRTKVRATAFTHRSNGTVFSWCKACNKDYQRERAARKRAERDGGQ